MKIVQIGLGVWGENHAKILSELGVLSAVCDSDSLKSKEYGEKYSVNHYDSLDKLISTEEFDAAFVGTSVSTHEEVITKLLCEKKHVLVEKPMILDSSKGEKLKELSEKNKVLFTCGFDERFNSGVQFLKNSVTEKKYGELVTLEFFRESKLSSPDNIGVVFESSINDIDIANWIFEEFPVVVYARLGSTDENENFASIMLGYKNNKTAIVLSNGFSSKKDRKIKAVCSNATVTSDLNSLQVNVSSEDNPNHLEKNDSMLLHIQNFIDTIEGKSNLSVKPQEIVNLTKISEAALLSSKQGVPIYLDLK